jgi:predicted dehydrogenase
MKPYRVGIVGSGFGAVAHLPALTHHPDFTVVAIASPTNASRIAREANVPNAFESCQAMLDGCELAVVTVASPPFAHHADVLAALAAGKHVMCEKPFALNVEQAEEMLAASRAAGTACGVAHEFRFVPQIQAIKELLVNRHLEPPRDLELTLLRSNLRRSERRARSWWFERERGGGLAGAALSHLIDQSNWFAGRPPQRVTGLLRTANPQRRDERGQFTSSVDDGGFAVLDYGDGLVGRLAVDGTTVVESYTCGAHAENRTAVASGPTITDLTLYAIDSDGTDELVCKASPYARHLSIHSHVPYLMELYDEFAKAIDGKPNALPTFDDALVTQKALATIGYGEHR